MSDKQKYLRPTKATTGVGNNAGERNLAPGCRQLGPNAFAGMKKHEAYRGLPDRVETHNNLLTMFKRAAPEMGIREHLVSLFERLVLFSQPQDWESGRTPIVWPSNAYLAEVSGLCRRQVAYRLKALMEANLIVAKDSPSGRRYGRRDANGNITEAYGFALGLLAVRYDEFREIAERAAAERTAKQSRRREITIARRGIRQVAQAGLEHNVPGCDWANLAALADGQKPSLIDDLGWLEEAAARFTEIREKAEKHFNEAVETQTPQTNAIDRLDPPTKTRPHGEIPMTPNIA